MIGSIEVKERLKSLGLENDADYRDLIEHALLSTYSSISNKCNTDRIDVSLDYIMTDRVCGEILFTMLKSGRLPATFDDESAIKSIQTGDTSITYAVGDGSDSTEGRLNQLINDLRTRGEEELLSYRKLRW